jgi:hypothetical protein
VLQTKIESRRSLHAHARDARRRLRWSAGEWEEWARGHATGLIAAIGEREFDMLMRVVWKLR